VATVVAIAALLCVVVAVAGERGTPASADPVALAVPAGQLPAINAATVSCPALTGPRLAGQLMANSGFSATATMAGGGHGVAGLSDQAWGRWAPRADAQRSDDGANITALAHVMCDLIGQARAAKVPGDQWRSALASFASGAPPGAAMSQDTAGYVERVVRYADWYQQQPQFGGAAPAPSAAASPSAASLAAPLPVPDAYVQPLLAAGSVCATVTPPRLAAQLMAQSAFNPNRLSARGQEGIAQFLQQEWAYYNVDPTATPWRPQQAIMALGRAMCDLATQVSAQDPKTDSYAGALTAFEWGVTSVALAGGVPTSPDRTLSAAVNSYLPYYAKDPRLSGAVRSSSAPPAPPARRPSSAPNAAPPVQPAAPNAYGRIEAELYSAQSGVTLEDCADAGGGKDVGNLAPGDWLEYDYVDFGSVPASRFLVRYASNLPSGMTGQFQFQLRLDATVNAPVAVAPISSTGGWQTWQLTSVPINPPVTGRHKVYLTFTSSSGWEIGNLNWLSFAH
jgi:hypothetical protein